MSANLFDANFYRAVNPDLAGFSDEQAREHLLAFGLNEGRRFSPYVDLNFYRNQYPDLAVAGLTSNRQLYDHLENIGVAESRVFSTVFNNIFYGGNNEDLRAAGLNNEQLFEHFQNFGIKEGRQASYAFDASLYLEANPDLVAARLNNRQALEHFRTVGINEGRASSEFFNVSFYQDTNPDLRQAGFNNQQALEHYLRFGMAEGRPGEPPNNSHFAIRTGVLREPRAFRDWVGLADRNDYYRFSLDTNSEVNIRLDELADRTTLSLSSLNQGLVRNEGSDNNPREIREILPPGTYILSVQSPFPSRPEFFPDLVPNPTGYNLTLSATPFGISGDRAGNNLSEARDWGVLNNGEERLESDLVWAADPEDFYRFTLNAPSTMNLRASFAELQLIEDLNNNGTIETDEITISSSPMSSFGGGLFFPPVQTPAIIDNLNLLPGTYFVRVPESPSGVAKYELRASAETFAIPPDNAGNTLSEAGNVDVLTGNPVVSDFVGEAVDEADFYIFTLDRTTNVSLALETLDTYNITFATGTGFSLIDFKLNMQLIEDFNGNGIVDAGEAIASQEIETLQSNIINQILEAGTYFVGVETANINTDYTLSFST